MHPRLSVSEISSYRYDLDEDLAFWAEAGITRVGVSLAKLQATGDPLAAVDRVHAAGVHVANLLAPGPFRLDRPEEWSAQRQQADVLMDVALALRPEVVIMTTGPAGVLPWERAADAFAEITRGIVAEADREGLLFAIEPTHALRADVGFVHTLRDAMELGFRVDMGVCLEVQSCWAERNLAGTITAGVDAIVAVQVSDYAIGTHCTPDRRVPGDGDLPIERIVRLLEDAGYEGTYDVEIIGPRIEEEGYPSAVARSLAWMTDLLTELECGPEDEEDATEADEDRDRDDDRTRDEAGAHDEVHERDRGTHDGDGTDG